MALKETINFLERKISYDISKWHWGKLHTLEHEHLLGKIWPLSGAFNIGPHAVPGASSQVNNMTHKRYTENFKVTLGPATRRVIDYREPRISKGILPTGISGLTGTKHYDDQAVMYATGKYRNQYLNIDDIAKENRKVLVLKPVN
jgi:penicillin amidase